MTEMTLAQPPRWIRARPRPRFAGKATTYIFLRRGHAQLVEK
jgi:hypothetical protein